MTDSLALDYDRKWPGNSIALGADVAVPVFDEDQMWGVLTFSGKVTGEPLTSQELELVYYLMGQLGGDSQPPSARPDCEPAAVCERGVGARPDRRDRGGTEQSRSHGESSRLRVAGLNDKEVVGQDISRLPSRVADVVFEALQTGQEIHQREVTLPREHRPLGISATRFAMTSGGAVSRRGGLGCGRAD